MTDGDIAKAVGKDRSAAQLGIDWSEAELVLPEPKQAISIRLDRDVIEFFKHKGPGYQTKINAVLRSYMRHEGGKS